MIRLIPGLVVFIAHQSFATDIIAHRGYSCTATENTIQSVTAAWQAGADGVEVDVRVSSDGVVYLFHDDEIAGTKLPNLQFAQIVTLSEAPIATLSELLENVNHTGFYIFDLKEENPDKLDAVLEVVRKSGLEAESISFQGESLRSLHYVKHHMPSASVSYLTHLKWKIPYLVHPNAKQLVAELSGLDIDRVSIKGRSFVDAEFIEAIQASGREVHIWTINDPRRARQYEKFGTNGIITDHVESLLGQQECEATLAKVG